MTKPNTTQLFLIKIGILLGRYTDITPGKIKKLTGDEPTAIAHWLKEEFNIVVERGQSLDEIYKQLQRKCYRKQPKLKT